MYLYFLDTPHIRIQRKTINGSVTCEKWDGAPVKCVPSQHGLVRPHSADGLCGLQEETVAEIKQLRALDKFVVLYFDRFRQRYLQFTSRKVAAYVIRFNVLSVENIKISLL
jgi:hypothetical protein